MYAYLLRIWDAVIGISNFIPYFLIILCPPARLQLVLDLVKKYVFTQFQALAVTVKIISNCVSLAGRMSCFIHSWLVCDHQLVHKYNFNFHSKDNLSLLVWVHDVQIHYFLFPYYYIENCTLNSLVHLADIIFGWITF